jgi:hypothetical protein
MLNMDMIARNDPYKVTVYGLKHSAQLTEIVNSANYCSLQISSVAMTWHSDHYNFYDKGVPAIFFCTGMHPDLHKPTDTADKCDFDKAERIAEVVALATLAAANYTGKIEMERSTEPDPLGGGGGRGRRGPRLGITPEMVDLDKDTRDKFGLDENDAGIKIVGIAHDSVAHKGGLQEGDILIELNGKRIPSDGMRQFFGDLFRSVERGKPMPYTVIRDGKKVTGDITFP